jgi:hypothetical protein
MQDSQQGEHWPPSHLSIDVVVGPVNSKSRSIWSSLDFISDALVPLLYPLCPCFLASNNRGYNTWPTKPRRRISITSPCCQVTIKLCQLRECTGAHSCDNTAEVDRAGAWERLQSRFPRNRNAPRPQESSCRRSRSRLWPS